MRSQKSPMLRNHLSPLLYAIRQALPSFLRCLREPENPCIILSHRAEESMSEPSTPLMRQYTAIKKRFPHALLFFRLGDFYELFFEDAVVAARELQITLTSRNKEKGEPVPMCGGPAQAPDTYISRLIQKGHKVAICEQMEDPRPGKP